MKLNLSLLLAAITSVNAQRRAELQEGGDRAIFGSGNTCVNGVAPKRWKSRAECCPCPNEKNCELLLGPDGGCQPGDDCYKTAFTYPSSVGCEAELHNYHWMEDIAEVGGCSYCQVEDDVYVVDVDYTGCGGDEAPFATACSVQVGCRRRSRHLNVIDENRPHRRHISEEEDGLSVHVESDHDGRLLWLKDHVVDMQKRMESGKAARAWDPLFKAYFDNLDDINLECSTSDQDVRCTSTGKSECALDLIQAHASYHNEIAASIEENGTHMIKSDHAIPDSCK